MVNFILSLWYRYKSWRYERKCIKYLGMKPEKVYLSKENFDALVERLNQPPDPAVVERIKELMQKVPPWEKEE